MYAQTEAQVVSDPRYVGVYNDHILIYRIHSKYYGLTIESDGKVRVALSIRDGQERVRHSRVFGDSVVLVDAWCRKVHGAPHAFTSIAQTHQVYSEAQNAVSKTALSTELATQETLTIQRIFPLPRCGGCQRAVTSQRCGFHACGAVICAECLTTKGIICVECKKACKGYELTGAMDKMMRGALQSRWYKCNVCRLTNLRWRDVETHVKDVCHVTCATCYYEVPRAELHGHMVSCRVCLQAHLCGQVHTCLGVNECAWQCGAKASSIAEIVKHHLICPKAIVSCKCGAMFPWAEEAKHAQMCPEKLYRCVCGRTMPNKEQASHRETCSHRIVECDCGAPVESRDMDVHKQVCPDVMVTCRCGKSFPRFYTQPHNVSCAKRAIECKWCKVCIEYDQTETHDKICTNKLTLCPLGCKALMLRKDRAAHYVSCSGRIRKCACGATFDTEICVTSTKAHWLTKMKERLEHREVCPLFEIRCVCGKQYLRKDKARHEAVCPDAKMLCAQCNEVVARKDLESHKTTCGVVKCECGESYLEAKRFKHFETCLSYYDLCPVKGCLAQGLRGNMVAHECPQTQPDAELKPPRPGMRYDLFVREFDYCVKSFLDAGVIPVRVLDVDKNALWADEMHNTEDGPDESVHEAYVIDDSASSISEKFFCPMLRNGFLPFRAITQFGIYPGKSVRVMNTRGVMCKTTIKCITNDCLRFEASDVLSLPLTICPNWAFFHLFDESDLAPGMCFHAEREVHDGKVKEYVLVVVQIQSIGTHCIIVKQIEHGRDYKESPDQVGDYFILPRSSARDHLSLLGFDLPDSIKTLPKPKKTPGYVFVPIPEKPEPSSQDNKRKREETNHLNAHRLCPMCKQCYLDKGKQKCAQCLPTDAQRKAKSRKHKASQPQANGIPTKRKHDDNPLLNLAEAASKRAQLEDPKLAKKLAALKSGKTQDLDKIGFLTRSEITDSCKSSSLERTQAMFSILGNMRMTWIHRAEVASQLQKQGFADGQQFLWNKGDKSRARPGLTLDLLSTQTDDLLCFFDNQVLLCTK